MTKGPDCDKLTKLFTDQREILQNQRLKHSKLSKPSMILKDSSTITHLMKCDDDVYLNMGALSNFVRSHRGVNRLLAGFGVCNSIGN